MHVHTYSPAYRCAHSMHGERSHSLSGSIKGFFMNWSTLLRDLTVSVEALYSENANKRQFLIAEFENYIDTRKATPVYTCRECDSNSHFEIILFDISNMPGNISGPASLIRSFTGTVNTLCHSRCVFILKNNVFFLF